ncbi:MAG: hypothetical protein AAFX52_04240 [Pseudomonadota bacterium]
MLFSAHQFQKVFQQMARRDEAGKFLLPLERCFEVRRVVRRSFTQYKTALLDPLAETLSHAGHNGESECCAMRPLFLVKAWLE